MRKAVQCVFVVLNHSGASHSHTMYVISSAVKHCNSKLTSLLPARNTLQVINQPCTPSSMVWLLLLLETAFVCLLINFEENVQFMQFVPKCCLAIEYIQYKMVLLETVFICFLIYCEASLLTRKCCMQLITSHDKKDCDGKTNVETSLRQIFPDDPLDFPLFTPICIVQHYLPYT